MATDFFNFGSLGKREEDEDVASPSTDIGEDLDFGFGEPTSAIDSTDTEDEGVIDTPELAPPINPNDPVARARLRAMGQEKMDKEVSLMDQIFMAIGAGPTPMIQGGTGGASFAGQRATGVVPVGVEEGIRGVELTYDMTNRMIDKGHIGTRIKLGTATKADYEELNKIAKLDKEVQEEIKDLPMAIEAMTNLAPFMVDSAKKGAKGGLVGSMVGGVTMAALGNLIPGFALSPLDEPVTATAGAFLGGKIGAAFNGINNIASIEGGLAYMEFKEMGMDDDKARLASDLVGTGSGILELAQFKLLKRLIPGSSKAVSGAIGKAISKVLGDNKVLGQTGKLAGTAAGEASVETLQEFWKNVVETAATNLRTEDDMKDLSDKDWAEVKDGLSKGLYDTFTKTFVAFGGFGLPTAGINLTTAAVDKNLTTVASNDTTTLVGEEFESAKDINLADKAGFDAVGSRPSVSQLLGENDRKTDIDGDLSVTDKQTTGQLDTGETVKKVLSDITADRGLRQTAVKIETGEDKMDELKEHYSNAIDAQDVDGAMSLANEIQAQANTNADNYIKMLNDAGVKAANNNSELSQDVYHEINAHVKIQQEYAAKQVEAQKAAVVVEQTKQNQAYIEKVGTEKGLKDELIESSVNKKMKDGKELKTNETVISAMMEKEYKGAVKYAEETPIKELLKLQREVGKQTMLDRRNNEPADVQARNTAMDNWVKGQLAARAIVDSKETERAGLELELQRSMERQMLADRAIQEEEDAQKFEDRKAPVTSRVPQGEGDLNIVNQAEDKLKAERTKDERIDAAKKNVAAQEKAATVSKQKAKISKPVAGPTRKAELDTAKAEKKSRDTKLRQLIDKNKDLEPQEGEDQISQAQKIMPKGVKVDAIGKKEHGLEGKVQVTVKDKTRMSDGSTLYIDPKKDVQAQVNKTEVQFITVPKLKKEGTSWTIVTSDNPQSTTASKAANTKARSKLKGKLDSMGIAYKLGTSKFGTDSEIPFVISGLTRKQAKELSDELGQSSFIFAEGNKVDFVEGNDTITRKKEQMNTKIKEGDDYTEVDGIKFSIPFFEDTESDLDTVEMQIEDDTLATTAKKLFRAAAIRLPNGKVYEGAAHPKIMMDNTAVEDYVIATPVKELSKNMMGFVTHDGQFVTRDGASKLVKTDKLISEDFIQQQIVDTKYDRMQKEMNAAVADFSKLTLESKMGTLELMDALEKEMKLGKYKWLFDKTKANKTKTIFVTQEGQFGKLEEVKRTYNNMKAKEAMIQRFEGAQSMDAKGNMKRSGGVKGLFIKPENTVIMNLPAIRRTADNVAQARETAVHENIHALVNASWESMSTQEKAAFENELKVWRDSIGDTQFWSALRDNPEVHPRVRVGAKQIMESVGEIPTYSLAHPEFAAWLNTMPASPRFKAMSKKIKTMWDALMHMIGTKVLKTPSKLDEITDILNRHMKTGQKEVRFSMDDSFDFGENVNKTRVEDWAAEMDLAAENALPVTVFENKAEMDKAIGYEIPEGVAAVWTDDGRVLMNAELVTDQDHFTSLWLHEQVAHQGLRNVFGGNEGAFNRFLDQAYTLFTVKESTEFFKMVEVYDFGKVNANGDRTMNAKQKREAAEEFIARKAQTLKPTTKKGLLKRFKELLQRWLPADFVLKKISGKMPLSDADIMTVLEAAKENVMTGNNKFGDYLTKAMDARAPKHKFTPWKNIPNFMKSDREYLDLMKKVLKEAPNMRTWYTEHTEVMKEAFGKDYDLFALLLAVTSPQAPVENNVAFAVESYAYLMGLTDKPGAMYPGALQKRMDMRWTSVDGMLADLESKQFKVTEFVRALLGDENATVGDVWMYRLFFGDSAVFNKDSETYSVPMITGQRQKVHSLAAQMTQETGDLWTPREVQAALWVGVNAAQTGTAIKDIATFKSGLNKPQEKYNGKSPLEWLNSKVPNLKDGPLSEQIGLTNLPLAPVSPLQKKVIRQKMKDNVAQYPVSSKGVIKLLKPNESHESTIKLANSIQAGGRLLTAPNAEMATWYQKTFGFEAMDSDLDMQLRDDALSLYTQVTKKGKATVRATKVIDNLGGFQGNYTQEVRYARAAKSALNETADMKFDEVDQQFLKSGNDGQSVTSKIHEWRDQAELNVNRFINQIEQQFLEKFGGRRPMLSTATGLGSGRKVNTADTELLQKAMNLFIDSGTGANRSKAEAYASKLIAKHKAGSITAGELQQLDQITRMLSLNEEEVSWVNNTLRPYYEEFFEFAQDRDLIQSHVDNYVKRMWKIPKKYEDAGITWDGTSNGMKLKPTSGKERSLESIIDGWELGMELRTDGVLQNLQSYANEIGYVNANRRFMQYMDSLINETGDGLIIEVENENRAPAGYKKLKDRGFSQGGMVAFARADLADEINKLGGNASHEFWSMPFVAGARRVGSMIKSTLLSVSMFHHLAGLRSYVFGVTGTGWQRLRPVKAYREGLKKIDQETGFDDPNYQHLGAIVDLLVREGLTLGKTQDWDDVGQMDSWIENTLKGSSVPGSAKALTKWQNARRWKAQWTNGLFGRLFAGLKAQSAAVELTHTMRKMEKKLGRGLTDAEIKSEAIKVARLINADYGGLHLKRMGRNPDLQKVLQTLMLAPDWTESNWRTVTGMLPKVNNWIDKAAHQNPGPKGMDKVYRKFWFGIALRAGIATAVAQAAVLMLFGDDDDREEYWHNQIKGSFTSVEAFSKGRWAKVDITPIADAMGIEPKSGKRLSLSIAGHFNDIWKVADPVVLMKHKQSPLVRVVESMVNRTDWKGDRFKTAGEWWKADGFGLVADRYTDGETEGFASAAQLPIALLYNIRQSLPIPLSEVLVGVSGEGSMISSAVKAFGVDVRDVNHVNPDQTLYWEKVQEIKLLSRALDTARAARDPEMITEAKEDIKEYDNYNRVKSRLGFTRVQLGPINKRIKALEAKEEQKGLSTSEWDKLKELRARRVKIFSKFADVIKR